MLKSFIDSIFVSIRNGITEVFVNVPQDFTKTVGDAWRDAPRTYETTAEYTARRREADDRKFAAYLRSKGEYEDARLYDSRY